MVKDIYEKFPEEAKIVMNVLVGKMERHCPMSEIYKLKKICNEDEASRSNGVTHHIGDDLVAVMERDIRFSIYTQKPISVQIKDSSRRLLFAKMLELNLKESDIVQIKTDSFSWVDRDRKIDTFNFENDDINKWKKEEFKKLKTKKKYFKRVLSFSDTPRVLNKMANAYAGAGKTHHIINTEVPKLKDFIVLTPSHSSIKEYRVAKLNCNTVQYYTNNGIIPTEQTVIFDEHGLMDRRGHDLIYKCYLAGKNIQSYGDWNQLLPVNDTHYNSKHYLDMIFPTIEPMETNYRNHFTKKYYDSIIEGTKKYGKEQVNKHSSESWQTADVILCYRNDTRGMYNDMKLEQLGFKNMYQVGVKLVCKTNNLSKFGIYNNYSMTIKSIVKGIFTLDDGTELKHRQIGQNFILGYAVNLYGIQGRSIKSYYWCSSGNNFIDQRSAYTIVSRLKTK